MNADPYVFGTGEGGIDSFKWRWKRKRRYLGKGKIGVQWCGGMSRGFHLTQNDRPHEILIARSLPPRAFVNNRGIVLTTFSMVGMLLCKVTHVKYILVLSTEGPIWVFQKTTFLLPQGKGKFNKEANLGLSKTTSTSMR